MSVIGARTCSCLCPRWKHEGICTTQATTSRVFSTLSMGMIRVPLCRPCAEDVDRVVAKEKEEAQDG